MIEEAAGTSMYETKRDLALKNIEKKESKLSELNNVSAQTITKTTFVSIVFPISSS
jgi:structural maintenance of chromosome 2